MNIMQAIKYPIDGKRFMSVVGVPALLLFGSILASSAVIAAALFPLIASLSNAPMGNMMAPNSAIPPGLPSGMAMSSLLMAVGGACAISLIFTLPISGYYWELIDVLQSQGSDAPAPRWKGNWKRHYKSGFHFFLASLMMAIPMLLAAMTLGLLMPFVMAPFFLAAREKTVKSVLQNLGQGFQLGKQRLIPVFIAVLLTGLVLNIAYSIGASALSWTIVGGPLIMQAYVVTSIHLLVQQFGYQSQPNAGVARMSKKEAADVTEGGLPQQMVMTTSAGLQFSDSAEGFTGQLNEGPATDAADDAVLIFPNPESPELESVASSAPAAASPQKIIQFAKGDNPWLRHRQ